jgi:hypothetical protein
MVYQYLLMFDSLTDYLSEYDVNLLNFLNETIGIETQQQCKQNEEQKH